MERGFELVTRVGDKGILPLRATKHSAGYDFYTLEDITIKPGETVKTMTGVKAKMKEDEVLVIHVRSSLGIKKGLILANATGIGDSDYYNCEENEGEYCVCLRNLNPSVGVGEPVKLVKANGSPITITPAIDLTEANTITIPAGERVAQGIFMKYLVADNCNSDSDRVGGTGSTNK